MRHLPCAAILFVSLSPMRSGAEIQLAAFLEAGVSDAVAVHGNYILGGLGNFLLSIDMTNPAFPVRINSEGFSSHIYGIVISEDIAYVATDANLTILDISNPASPSLLGVETGAGGSDVALRGTYAYLMRGSKGIRSIDISDPSHPIAVGSATFSNWPRGIDIAGSYGYTAGFLNVLQVLDLSNPSAPSVIASLPVHGTEIEIDGHHAYLADWDRLTIVDISVPTSPVQVGIFTDTWMWGVACVAVSGTYAYALGVYGDVNVIDVSDPSHPIRAAYETSFGGNDVTCVANRLYAADESSFRIVDISVPNSPSLVGTQRSLSSPRTVVLHDGRLLVGEEGRLTTMDVHDASSPEWVSWFKNDYWPYRALAPSGSILLAGREASILDGGDGGLSIFDMSQPSSPVELSNRWGFDSVYDVHVDATFAYLLGAPSASQAAFVTYDVTNLTAPIQVSTVAVPFLSQNFDMSGNLALIACLANDLKIYDVTNHTQPPVLVSTFAGTTDARDVVAVGNTAFVADRTRGLVVIDFSNPSSPTEIGSLSNIGQPTNIVAAFPHVVMVGADPLLRIVDVSEPSSPVVVDSYQTGASHDVSVEGSTIATVIGYGPVVLLNAPVLNVPTVVSTPGAHVNLDVHPNPFNPHTSISFSLPSSTQVALEVFDATGRRVRTLMNVALAAGEHKASWDGRDGAGVQCASGVYFARLSAGVETQTRKLVLLK